MNMEYIKSYFNSDSSSDLPLIVDAPAVPLKAKVGILYITNSLEMQQALKTLAHAAKNPELLGIILCIENNGGDCGQFSAFHDLIKKATTIKPVVGIVHGNALSGGYLIASATNFLICAEASNIGSIGAITELQKLSEHHLVGNSNNNYDAKIDLEIFNAGTYKTIYNANAPLTETQRHYVQESVDKTYQYFISLVARNRNICTEDYLDWADAKVFFGFEALELGLVDQIGTLLDAEEKVLELIKQKSPDITFDNTIETVELN